MSRGSGWLVTALMGVCAFGGCGSSSPEPTTPSSAVPTPTAGTMLETCAVRTGGPPGPVTDGGGPYFHQVMVARTSDGLSLRNARMVLDHASVPDGVRFQGAVLIYYVNGAEGSVWAARLEGDTATPLAPISLNGIERPAGVVDPDATLLPGGRIRLAYLNGFGPPGTGTPRAMCLADSTDGLHFTVVGAAVQLGVGDSTTDPSLVQLPTGSWLMAMSRGQSTVLARSPDGLTFATGETLTLGGVPELSLLADGRVRLYVCAQGIQAFVSSDEGRSWQHEGPVVQPGFGGPSIACDPSMVAGSDVFLYKTAG